MIKLAIVLGSTREGRRGAAVADWVLALAAAREDLEPELLDLRDFALPVLDEPEPPLKGEPVHAHTTRWARAVGRFDAYVFVTPEYNRSIPGPLKNAIDFLYHEWCDKAACFVSYGTDAAGTRAVEHLRVVMGELKVADVRTQVALSLQHDWEAWTTFAPGALAHRKAEEMLDQVTAWATALRTLRVPA